MYQASIRDKKKHQKFHNVRVDNYELNATYEEYAYVKKLLGNCRVLVLTNSGIEAIGVIRGTLRKFNNRIIIEAGDIVVVSKRDYQVSKVDIIHKYNSDQIQCLINEEKLSKILFNSYTYKTTDTNDSSTHNDDNYIDFGDILYESDKSDEENNTKKAKKFKRINLNAKFDSDNSDISDNSDNEDET
jgi:translation initiation factor 1A